MVRLLHARHARRDTLAVALVAACLGACVGDDAPPAGGDDDDDDGPTTTMSTSGEPDDASGSAAATSTAGSTDGASTGEPDDGSSTSANASTSESSGANTTSDEGTTTGANTSTGATEGEDASSTGEASTGSGTTGESEGESSSDSAGTTDSGTTGGPPVCFDVDLMGRAGVYHGTTVGAGNDHQGSCLLNPGGADVGHFFVPSESGFYAFTVTAEHDPTLTILLGDDCRAPELACDDDYAVDDASSRISEYLTPGMELLAIVDGATAGENGPYELAIEPQLGACYESVIIASGDPPWSATGDNTKARDNLDGSCSEVQGGRDVIFRFTPPAAGEYTISTIGSSYDTVVYVREAGCSFTEIGCDDDSGIGLTSLLDVTLEASQEVTVVVDAFDPLDTGHYLVEITPAD